LKGEVGITVEPSGVAAWLPYALASALWKYEPGFAGERIRNLGLTPVLAEESECVLCMVWGYKNFKEKRKDAGKTAEDPFMEELCRIWAGGYLQEFILFNVAGRRDPSIMVVLSDAQRDRIAQYVEHYIIGKEDGQMEKNK